MSRVIEIMDTSGFYWSVSIDGNVIHLGKRLCRVDFGNADNLNSALKDIEDVFIWRHTFSDVQSRTNTFNLLILLNSIYYESTLELFQYHCAEIMKQCDTPFAETFTKVFGSCPEKKYRRLSIISEISKIYKDIHFQFYSPLKLKRSKYASSSQFFVKYIASTGNVISYTINDEPLDICLRGKTHLVEATNVLSVIENLQVALASEDKTTILSIFEEVGYLNALDIIRICYPKLAICFFTRIAERMVRTRQRVYPFLLLKNYIKTVPYQGNARKFFYALLEQLEDRVPYYDEQLIAGNEQELLSDKGTYTLYFRNANTLYSTELVFIGAFQLRKECKEFCLSYAKFGSKNLNIEKASLVSGIFRQLFSIMFNDLDIYIESIVSLTSSDVKILLSYLIQSSEFAYATIKKRILLLGKFYAYITGMEPTNPASAFYKLKLPVGESIHTTPISKAAKEYIIKEVSTAPPVYSVGIKIAFATGMRDGTFDTLTTDSLVYTQGHYVIRYFLKKTYKYRIENGLPVYNECQIPDELAMEIKEFINQTKNLRSQLNKPYLLVYQELNRRTGTHLPPRVLNGSGLQYFICNMLSKANIRNADGIIDRESLRSIRAEIGRALFASGKSAEEVSSFLGNSPVVASQSYNQCYPTDEARKYNSFYKETLEKSVFFSNSIEPEKQSRMVMFGTCSSDKICKGKDCRACPERITRKGGVTI